MHRLLAACIFGSLALSAAAQQLPSRIQGDNDQDIPVPSSNHKPLGQADASALAELVAYKLATGGSEWAGFTAQGRMFLDAGKDALPASLLILPGNRVKLDLTRPEGHDITFYNGSRGATEYATSKKVLLTPRGANAGLAPFDLPLLAAVGGSRFSIIDHGSVVVQDHVLHRITVETAIPQKYLFPYETDNRSVVDMYFDPSTHLLTKTASVIPIPGSSTSALLKVDSYSAYKRVGLLLTVPTTVTETINGQTVWTLILDSVDTTKTPSSSAFIF